MYKLCYWNDIEYYDRISNKKIFSKVKIIILIRKIIMKLSEKIFIMQIEYL